MDEKRDFFIAWIESLETLADKDKESEPDAAAARAMRDLGKLVTGKSFEHIPATLAALRPDYAYRPQTEEQSHYEAALDIAEVAYGQIGAGRTVPTAGQMWSYWLEQYAAHQERESERIANLEEKERRDALLQREARSAHADSGLLADNHMFRGMTGGAVGDAPPAPPMPGLYPFVDRS